MHASNCRATPPCGRFPLACCRRRRQRAAGDGMVGGVAGVGALAAAAADAPAEYTGRMDARRRHAVPGAAAFHFRLPADRVSALAGPGALVALALPADRPWPARRTTARTRRAVGGIAVAVVDWIAAKPRRLERGAGVLVVVAAPGARGQLACAQLRRRLATGLGR